LRMDQLSIENFQSWIIKTNQPVEDKVEKLTGITSEMAKKGSIFEEVINSISKRYSKKLVWTGWGNDRDIFLEQCEAAKINSPFGKDYINWGYMFHWRNYPLIERKIISLEKALNIYGMNFIGQKHRAKDDAFNLGRLVLKMIKVS